MLAPAPADVDAPTLEELPPPIMDDFNENPALIEVIGAAVAISHSSTEFIDWDLVADQCPLFAEYGLSASQLQPIWDQFIAHRSLDEFDWHETFAALDQAPSDAKEALDTYYKLGPPLNPWTEFRREIGNGKVHPRFFREDQIMWCLLAEVTNEKSRRTIRSSLRKLMRDTWIINDFDACLDYYKKQQLGTTSWRDLYKYVNRPNWLPIRNALLGTNEGLVQSKLDSIYKFLNPKKALDLVSKILLDKQKTFLDTLKVRHCTCLQDIRKIVDHQTELALASRNPSLPIFRQVLLLRLCFIENYYGAPRSAKDYSWLTFDQHYWTKLDQHTILIPNYVNLQDSHPHVVYVSEKKTTYTHPLSHNSCSLITAIRALSNSKFVLREWSPYSFETSNQNPENSVKRLLRAAWRNVVLQLPNSDSYFIVGGVDDVTFTFLRNLVVTWMAEEGHLNSYTQLKAVTDAMGTSVSMDIMPLKSVTPASTVFNPPAQE
ncbi:hypothetical protein HDU80_001745 [Chytriomyces hyalinus]|nr:hypothetical protein HDU80_001745 [Chytriomyces hyalinus]